MGSRAHRRHLHPRRAVDRPAPARQRQAARDAEAAARPRQLGASWSSTTRRRWRRPTGSSTSAPARASSAARSSPQGTPAQVMADPKSAHRRATSPGGMEIAVPETRRPPGQAASSPIEGATENNLKNVDVEFPLGLFVAVTGVSGAGKSTLVNEILYPALARALYDSARGPRASTTPIRGLEHLDKVIDIDQRPIGRTPRSNPATYTKVFDAHPRGVRADARGARLRLHAGPLLLQREGRPLRGVRGRRREAGRDALPRRRLRALRGLRRQALQRRDAAGPLQGQEHRRGARDERARGAGALRACTGTSCGCCRRSTTWASATSSSGRARPRSPAARRSASSSRASCAKVATGRTLYILDEPTTGLHFDDIRKLLDVLNRLVETREHGGGDRAQPRRDQERRLGDRPRPRGRRGRRADRRRGHAGGGRGGQRRATPAATSRTCSASRARPRVGRRVPELVSASA